MATLLLFAFGLVYVDDGWIDLMAGNGFEAWRKPTEAWLAADGVGLDAKNPKVFAIHPGKGVLVNGPKGKTKNLITTRSFGDVDVYCEFTIPKGSNSGVKMQELYEIQIFDSFGKKVIKGSDCGGIYPRSELKPKYHHIDEGYAPRVNACKAPGEWQTLEIRFRAPRFDAEGKKIANACFVKVVLNGQTIHENVELQSPTGDWHRKEVATGPLLLQADHGPVAFRALRVRPRAEAR